MKKNTSNQEVETLEVGCPVKSMEKYIVDIDSSSEGKLKKELAISLKDSLDIILKDFK